MPKTTNLLTVSDLYYSLAEMATIFGTSSKSIRRWVDQKKLPEPVELPCGLRWSKIVIDSILKDENNSGGVHHG